MIYPFNNKIQFKSNFYNWQAIGIVMSLKTFKCSHNDWFLLETNYQWLTIQFGFYVATNIQNLNQSDLSFGLA